MTNKPFRIVFMGTPDFAVASLKALIDANFDVVGVVTAPDKPAGRGRKLRPSPVKTFATEAQLPVLQPNKLRDPKFIKELETLQPDLFVVVAFRMLPKQVWALPTHQTINLHASLLPDFRGAAPINWAIIKGTELTGVTTFFIDEKIDTGRIIDRMPVPVDPTETAGSLHDKLMIAGARLLVQTVGKIKKGTAQPIAQQALLAQTPHRHEAPKLTKENTRINWIQAGKWVDHFIRGLSPYPGAWTELRHKPTGQTYHLKIYLSAIPEEKDVSGQPGQIRSDNKRTLAVRCKDNWLLIKELQLQGKKRMATQAFLAGHTISDYEIVTSHAQ